MSFAVYSINKIWCRKLGLYYFTHFFKSDTGTLRTRHNNTWTCLIRSKSRSGNQSRVDLYWHCNAVTVVKEILNIKNVWNSARNLQDLHLFNSFSPVYLYLKLLYAKLKIWNYWTAPVEVYVSCTKYCRTQTLPKSWRQRSDLSKNENSPSRWMLYLSLHQKLTSFLQLYYSYIYM